MQAARRACDFAAAGHGRFQREYHAYYIDQGAPCAYEKEGRTIHLVVAIRNDLAARVDDALRDLSLRPIELTARSVAPGSLSAR